MPGRSRGRVTVALLAILFPTLLVGPLTSVRAASIAVAPIARGLDFPAAFTFAPGGRIFYGERFTGEIRILDPRSGTDRLFATVPNLATAGEQGLLGIALHPNYPSTPAVFAFATRDVGGRLRNQILRWRAARGRGTQMRAIFGTGVGGNHNGGRIQFGPDRKLYTVVGENGTATNAQDLSVTMGKVLRMTAAGRAPADNPIAGSRVFSYGHRNSFGFDFDPRTGRLWETENGPQCNDELNLVRAGRNFGWGPSQTCGVPPQPPANTNQDGPDPVLPERFYTPTVAPTGAVFCGRCGLGRTTRGRLFVGEFNTGRIRKITLTATRRNVARQAVVLDRVRGILSMETNRRGRLFFSDSVGIYRLVLR